MASVTRLETPASPPVLRFVRGCSFRTVTPVPPVDAPEGFHWTIARYGMDEQRMVTTAGTIVVTKIVTGRPGIM